MKVDLDPVDGPLGNVAFLIGALWHLPIVIVLNLVRAINLDMVAYNLMRLVAGYLTIGSLLFVGVWFLIGVIPASITVGALLLVLLVLAACY